MLVIRMQRTGRTGHAQFRVVAQDKRFSPTSGRVVAYLGNYDPHTKDSKLDKEKIEQFLASGAQPSDRVIKLLKKEGFKLPKWANDPPKKQKATKNPDKFGSAEAPAAPAPAADTPAEDAPAEPAAESTDVPAAESPAEAPLAEAENTPEAAAEPESPEAPAEEVPAEQPAAEEPPTVEPAAEDPAK